MLYYICFDFRKIKLFHIYLNIFQDDPIFKKYKKMNAALVEIIQDYSLVSFVALNIKVSSPWNLWFAATF